MFVNKCFKSNKENIEKKSLCESNNDGEIVDNENDNLNENSTEINNNLTRKKTFRYSFYVNKFVFVFFELKLILIEKCRRPM
jgi:hypothetical protein